MVPTTTKRALGRMREHTQHRWFSVAPEFRGRCIRCNCAGLHHQRHGCTHAPTSSPVKTTMISLQHSRFSEREKEKRRERQRSTQREREKMFHLTHRTLFRERHVIERDSSLVVRRRGPFSSTRVNLARREHNFPACNETFACSVSLHGFPFGTHILGTNFGKVPFNKTLNS